MHGQGPGGRDALEGKGPQRRPQKQLHRRLEEVAKAVGGGYCRLQMPLRLALAIRGIVAGRRLGALEGGGGYLPPLGECLPPFQCIPRGGGVILQPSARPRCYSEPLTCPGALDRVRHTTGDAPRRGRASRGKAVRQPLLCSACGLYARACVGA